MHYFLYIQQKQKLEHVTNTIHGMNDLQWNFKYNNSVNISILLSFSQLHYTHKQLNIIIFRIFNYKLYILRWFYLILMLKIFISIMYQKKP